MRARHRGVKLNVFARRERGAALKVKLVHVGGRIPLGFAVLEQHKPIHLIALEPFRKPVARAAGADSHGVALLVHCRHHHLHSAWVAIAQRVQKVYVEELAAKLGLPTFFAIRIGAIIVQGVLDRFAVGSHLAGVNTSCDKMRGRLAEPVVQGGGGAPCR